MMQSSITQPLLNAFVGVMPTMPFVKKTLNLPSTFKQPGANRANILFGPYDLVTARVNHFYTIPFIYYQKTDK